MTIELKTGFWKQRDGNKAEVLAVRGSFAFGIDSIGFARQWNSYGSVLYSDDSLSLTIPWEDLPVIDWWVNIYSACVSPNHENRRKADDMQDPKRQDCRHLRYIDGKVIDVTGEKGK